MEYLGKAAGEGCMSEEQLWDEINKVIGGVKKGTKTYVLATRTTGALSTNTLKGPLIPREGCCTGFMR